MGRHAVDKKRKTERTKVRKWVIELLPKLQDISLADLTIDELATLMQKSKSTIYQYFKSKEEIIAYMTQVRLESMASFVQILREEPFRPKEQYQEFLLLLCEGVRDISPQLLHDLRLYYPTAWEMVTFFLNELIKETKAFFDRGIELGYFRSVSTELLARMDQFFVFQIMTDAEMVKDGLSLDALARDYLTVRLEGILK